MKILVINSGSSSIKYRLFVGRALDTAISGRVERIGEDKAHVRQHAVSGDDAGRELTFEATIRDHRDGLEAIFGLLGQARREDMKLDAVGHRVVHGGERYRDAVMVDDEVVEGIRALNPLAPLHNPASLAGIEVARELLPGVPQVAVFDTAFHQTMPPEAYLYAVPRDWYQRLDVRRYGFHGSSHRYVTARAATALGKDARQVALIILHLGNGASAAAIRDGRSVDTSMGMTPLEGLVMGTRCGDLDPSVLFYLNRRAGLDLASLESTLNTGSGLAGLAGVADMRDLLARVETGDAWAKRAYDLYIYRIRKYIGAYMAVLGDIDALVFTGGVGENNAGLRESCCAGLECLGIRIDDSRNRDASGEVAAIHHAGAKIQTLVVKTNEELQIATEVAEALQFRRSDGGIL